MEKSAQADSREKLDEVVLECLQDPRKWKLLNDTMAVTIAREVYDFSLARVLLLPRRVGEGACPVYEGVNGAPVVMVNLARKETRVLHCRAFRDSLREEETVTSVQDIEYLAIRGKVRPASFPLSNVCTVKVTQLVRSPYSIVERARQHLRRNLVQDETGVVLRALSWVCARYGRARWSTSKSLPIQIEKAVRHAGLQRNPAIVCSPLSLAVMLNSGKPMKMVSMAAQMEPNMPMVAVDVDGQAIPVFVNQAVSNCVFYVVPCGVNLGQMPIFTEATIMNYDSRERLVKGWQLWQEQGIVFTNPKATSAIHFGCGGLWGAVESWLGWGFSGRP